MKPPWYAYARCTCASAFPSTTCFCTRRTASASDLEDDARQSGHLLSYWSHSSEHAVQMLLQQQS
eukprot:CAMPEP_0184249606 /NCGR_PEP_ID=MMETSP0977-20130417/3990_1 /TAXON_ID=483370 /ORGANISM="non described non described, Strain CCMP2097" /LENGTH=64 /DNA_ID=CAMNT_0026555009 /DNA_START=147 /DNA_END=341 /DNA_ORIENTATION=+